MAREWWTGIEMGDLLEWDTVYTSGASTVAVSTSVVRSGAYSLRLYGQGIGYAYVQHDLATAVAELYVRVGFRFDTNNIENAPVINFLDTAGAELGTVYISSNNYLHADIGGSDVATGPTTLQVDTWYLLEARLKVDDSAGVFQVHLDGSTEINFSGDTKPGSTTTIGSVRFEGGVTWASTGATYIDDIAINDTTGTRDIDWPGEGHIVAYAPAANGTYNDFAIGGSSPPANDWQAVDDIPANDDTDYVYSSTTGEQSTFTSAASGLVAVAIKHMAIEGRFAESAATGETMAIMIRNNSTDHVGTYNALTTSYSNVFREDYAQDPDTSADWTVASVDNLEFGVEAG